jgi:hypothetical protein
MMSSPKKSLLGFLDNFFQKKHLSQNIPFKKNSSCFDNFSSKHNQ